MKYSLEHAIKFVQMYAHYHLNPVKREMVFGELGQSQHQYLVSVPLALLNVMHVKLEYWQPPL
ncbi:hypothetical protein D1872_346470 [compost metagenome]